MSAQQSDYITNQLRRGIRVKINEQQKILLVMDMCNQIRNLRVFNQMESEIERSEADKMMCRLTVPSVMRKWYGGNEWHCPDSKTSDCQVHIARDATKRSWRRVIVLWRTIIT